MVEQYLAFAETMAQAQIPMKMVDWIKRLDAILELNQKNILNHSGKISHTLAEEKAEIEYNMYKQKQKQNEYIDIIQELESDIKSLAKSK